MMKLVVGGTVVADNLTIVLLPRAGDLISITDIHGVKNTYTVNNVEFAFEDKGNYQALDPTKVQLSYETIVNAT